jgi:hypothetical protein
VADDSLRSRRKLLAAGSRNHSQTPTKENAVRAFLARISSQSCSGDRSVNWRATEISCGYWVTGTKKTKVRVATLKSVDAARAFYDATPELHSKDVTWNTFKKGFQDWFKEDRTDQFHFSNLHRAHQAQNEGHTWLCRPCAKLGT